MKNDPDFFQLLEDVPHAHLKYNVEQKYYSPSNQIISCINAPSMTLQVLDEDVGLNSRTAASIIDYRDGEDNIMGNTDDRFIASIGELDSIKYVGPKSIEKLSEYCSGDVKHSNTSDIALLNYMNSSAITFKLLDVDMGLRSDAAQSIFDFRAGADQVIGTSDDGLFYYVQDILDLARVGENSMEKIKQFTFVNGI